MTEAVAEPFTGHQPRECGEHRAYPRRAYCLECSEWCYPDEEMGCKGCRIPALEKATEESEAVRLVEAAMFLRHLGERPPGAAKDDPEAETWRNWERDAEAFLRSRFGLDKP